MVMTEEVLLIKGIPRDYCKYSFDTLQELVGGKFPEYNHVQGLIDKWLNSDRTYGLFLYGKSGVGKTFIGCEIIKRLLDKRITARRLVMEDIYKYYFENWSIPDIIYKDEVLFIDDFGKEFEESEKKQKHIDKIINACLKYRKEKDKTTIISTSIFIENLNINSDSLDYIKDFLLPIRLPENNLRKIDYQRFKDKFLQK
jgi:chromosomal replication initiation ATPase DnaA